jgi:endonuclease YncB( thermonuclease family)
VELVKVPDEEIRSALMDRAAKSEWTRDHLVMKIKQEVQKEKFSINVNSNVQLVRGAKVKLTPRKGKLYKYRILAPDTVHKKQEENITLRMDLGFKVRRYLPKSSKTFKENQIIESKCKNQKFFIRESTHTETDLFTYKATIERVVDGDTLIVKIDLGFETEIRQYLRLRGLDCPEMDTIEGKRAKTFVEKELSKVSHILLVSSVSDKYDRYLADIYYGENDIFLNQYLLDQNLALRMR